MSSERVRVAILDDYQNVAFKFADWSGIQDRIIVDSFPDTTADEDVLAKRLEPYTVICNSTLEHIWALILATVRYIVVEDVRTKAGAVPWQATIPMGLAGRTLGLVGVGRLGSQTAAIAKAFGMEVVGWSPHLTPERAESAGVTFIASKEELLRRSDIVSVHMVLSDKTHHMITAADLALMKPSAFFINTSRGPLVDEAALIEVLQKKGIAGAGLDVFDEEPLPLDHPLRKLDNVTLSPHMGYVSDNNYEVFWGHTVENIAAFLDGRPTRVMDG
ncbi:hypothetical protein ONZ51_g5046 [Trametes cubensis]|uniref:D-isomer specific 2-hydroxyacid dehydrogenase NAD-binding domain-containing protein n=1 Tax=Trametes cubensis TaxID=1111947 RepID=A0AAD7TUV3_9APHY|nr:hypothetical protein ONZ51_g5046 [Trametes cubensis]